MIVLPRPHSLPPGHILAIALIALAITIGFVHEATLCAQDTPDLPPPPVVELPPVAPFGLNFVAEWIEVDLASLPKLLRKHGGEVDSTPLYEEVAELVEAEKAKSVEVIAGRVSPSGERIKIESIDEVIYPTEYDPAEIPNQITLDKDSNADLIPGTPPNPTAFETRNTGITVELETSIDENNRLLDVNLAPEHVEYYERDYHVAEEDARDSLLANVWSPRFYTMRVATRIRMKPDSIVLVGTFTPREEERRDKRLMLFIQVHTLKQPLPQLPVTDQPKAKEAKAEP